MADKVERVASAMAHVGVAPHGRAGIYSVNCPEWMEVMQVSFSLTKPLRMASRRLPWQASHARVTLS